MAVPAAAVVIGTGALPLAAARAEAGRLLPVAGFLAAVLVLGWLCEAEGLFTAAGARLARVSRQNPVRLLTGTFVLASATTAVLSLDATVVLLTPVVHETAIRQKLRAKPPVYACTHLANSASLLLPVSNLTNLLAFSASGLSLGYFTAVMSLPWLVAIAAEYVVFRLFFAADLAVPALAPAARGPAAAAATDTATGTAGRTTGTTGRTTGTTSTATGASADAGPAGENSADRPAESAGGGAGRAGARVPVFPLAVVAATLAGFTVTSFAGVSPAWAAACGAAVLAVRGLARRELSPAGLARAASVPFLLFVLSLGMVVRALTGNGLGGLITRILPHGSSLPALLAIAALAAAIANLVNNLPAVLVLLAAITGPGGGGPGHVAGPVLALLLGVNIGPNLTYAGSLATLLWRRLLAARDHEPDLGEFTRLGLATVPAGLLLATAALWLMLRLTGLG